VPTDIFVPNHFSQAEINGKSNVFIVTSTIHASQNPLSYNKVRSLFSDEERFSQTINTLESVHQYAPNALIFLVENSALTVEETECLQKHVDLVMCLARNATASKLRDGIYKGEAEAHLLLSVFPLLSIASYDKLFKLSGRYCLTEQFSVDRFPDDRMGFRLYAPDSCSTRLYSVPKIMEADYYRQIKRTYWWCRMGSSMENVIWRDVPIRNMARLGVIGRIATDGTLIEE
jgi:hypothetical protein